MLFLVATRAVLGNWQETNLLAVTIPLLGALAGIRFAVYLLRIGVSRSAGLGAFERSIAARV